MAERDKTHGKARPAPDRNDRLKAALKANLSRRKAQAKARSGAGDGKTNKTEE